MKNKTNMKNNYTDEQKEKVCDIVYEWMFLNDCHSAEQAAQNDTCNINAIDLVCDLADEVGIPYPDEEF